METLPCSLPCLHFHPSNHDPWAWNRGKLYFKSTILTAAHILSGDCGLDGSRYINYVPNPECHHFNLMFSDVESKITWTKHLLYFYSLKYWEFRKSP